MARSILVNGWNIPVRLSDFAFAEAARNGEVATGGFNLDSENAGVSINSHWDVSARETSAPAPDYLYEGYVADLSISRGPFAINRDRQYDVNIVDLNTLLIDDLMTGSSANRPEETDIARVNWLLGTSFLFGMGGNVGGGGSTTLEAADFRTQQPLNLLTQAAETSGKLFFVYWDFATEAPMLFYDLATSANFSTSSKISTFLADGSDSTTHHPVRDSLVRTLDGGRIYSELLYKYDGGSVTVTNSATASNYRPRKTVIYDNNVKTEAHATRKANKFLNFVSTPDDVITCDVHLTAAQINEFRAGQLTQVKAPHLGLPNFSEYRIVRTERKPRSGSHAPDQEDYTVTLELSVPRSITFGSRGVPTESLPDDVVDGGATPTEPAETEPGSCVNFSPRQWLRRVYPDGTELELGGYAALVVGSHVANNSAWSVSACPIGGGAWDQWEDVQSWFEFTAPADDPSYLGMIANIDATGAYTTGEFAGYHIGIVDGPMEAGRYKDATQFASGVIGSVMTVYIPRSHIAWGEINSLTMTPTWECCRACFFCNAAAYFGNPLLDGRGSSGGGWGINPQNICTVNFVSGTTGPTDHGVAGIGDVDGVNRTFTLIDWDGTGTPTLSINGVDESTLDVTYNRTTGTATLPSAPPAGAVVLWTYMVGALPTDITLAPDAVAIQILVPEPLIPPPVYLLPTPVAIILDIPAPTVSV